MLETEKIYGYRKKGREKKAYIRAEREKELSREKEDLLRVREKERKRERAEL